MTNNDMLGFSTALRAAMTEELCIEPDEILDVRVDWDDGDRYDPTYGDSPNAAPTFRVIVTTKHGDRTDLSIDFTFTTLLRLCLGIM